MKYPKLFAGVVLAAASLTAHATAPVNIGHTTTIVLDDDNSTFGNTFAAGNSGRAFLDVFNFTISGNSTLGASLTSTMSGKHDLNITSFGLYLNNVLVAPGHQISTGKVESWTLDALAPTQGLYSFRVGGRVLGQAGVSYSGDAYVTAVPEPETYGMVLGSLAVFGLVARRRKSAANASGAQAA